MSDKYKILFVCLGNICRSPAAEGIFRQMVEKRGLGEKLEADSAGTYAGHTGEQPDSRMRNAAYARGYLLTHGPGRCGCGISRSSIASWRWTTPITIIFIVWPLPVKRETVFTGCLNFSGNIRTGPMCQTPTTKGMKGSSWCSICSRTAAARCSTSWRRGSSKSQRTKKSAFFNALFFVESSLYAGAIRNIWSVERPNQK